MNKVFAIFMLLSSALIYGEGSWYEQKLEGWYYFEDAPKTEHKREKPATPEEAAHLAELEGHKLKALLALALMAPTEENIRNYITRQQKWIVQSQNFANHWKQLLLQDPLLGDLVGNPTSTYGIQERKRKETIEKQALLSKMANDHFLLFFFQGKDSFSQKAGEMVSLFAEENRWRVKAVSLDGKGLKNHADFEIDQDISKLIGVKVTPSFFVVNPEKKHVHPVGVGLLSLSELEDNIFFQFTHKTLEE